MSWALCAVCLLGHISHFFGANAPSWIHAFHSTTFHLSLSLLTLVGPGRRLILDGLKSLLRGAPNMNTLVGLGAISSFAVSSIAALVPKLVIIIIPSKSFSLPFLTGNRILFLAIQKKEKRIPFLVHSLGSMMMF